MRLTIGTILALWALSVLIGLYVGRFAAIAYLESHPHMCMINFDEPQIVQE